MFNVWFHSWLCIIFQLIHNIPTFSLDLCCVTLLRIFRQIAQIEHFSYAYFRVLFLARDGRRRGDPNGGGSITTVAGTITLGEDKRHVGREFQFVSRELKCS